MIDALFSGTHDAARAWFGNPWHGVVRGGVLTLPNGATMACPQPAAGADYAWKTGAVWLQQPPAEGGVRKALTRQPPADSADQAAGRSWFNYLLLSGYGPSGGNWAPLSYGKALSDGWYYMDANGVPWLCRSPNLVGVVDRHGGLSVQVQLMPNRILPPGRPVPDPVVVVAALADTGTVPSGQVWPVLYEPGLFSNQFAAVEVCDIKPDGSGVILALCGDPYLADPGAPVHPLRNVAKPPMGRTPIAFVELRLSGPGESVTAELVLLKGAASVLQRTISAGPQISRHAAVAGATSNYNAGTGKYDVTVTFSLVAGNEIGVCAGSGSSDEKQCIGMHYKADGSHGETWIHYTQTVTANWPAPTLPGPLSVSVAGGETVALPAVASASGSNTVSTSIALVREGQTVDSLSASYSETFDLSYGHQALVSQSSVQWIGRPEDLDALRFVGSKSWGSSAASGRVASGTADVLTAGTLPVLIVTWDVGLPTSGYGPSETAFRQVFPMAYRNEWPQLCLLEDEYREFVEPYRIGAFGFGLRLAVDDTGTEMVWNYRRCVGKWASSTGVQTFTTPKTSVEVRYGWENPMANTLTRGESSPGCAV